MFETKSNQEIGAYLEKLILSKYPTCRKFCVAYVDLTLEVKEDDDPNDMRDTEIRRLANKLSQILKGKKGIQIADLPVFSELLDVSCEEILSAGAVRKPISYRRTNYNIAFSQDEKDWKCYLAREDHIAAYKDEFGKTVIDYALEFRNYKFLKFLMDNDYIRFISDNEWYEYTFGAKSKIQRRSVFVPSLEDELRENKKLRTQLIALALENDDDTVLEELKAREFPVQYTSSPLYCNTVKFNEYYDEDYIDAIVNSKEKVFGYFCEEYYTKPKNGGEYQFRWIFPFFNKMIEKAVKTSPDRASFMLDKALDHNEKLFDDLKSEGYRAAKEERKLSPKISFNAALRESFLEWFHINEERNYISFYDWRCKGTPICGNIIKVDAKSKDAVIQDKIDLLNEYYNKIINLQQNNQSAR